MKNIELFGNAKWISTDLPCNAPLIRGSFAALNVKNAVITICGLGFFELYINGVKVSSDLFTPLSTDFHHRDITINGKLFDEITAHRIYCPKYDITSYLKEGQNQIGVMLAPGWYAQSVDNTCYGDVKLCYKIDLTDGKGNCSVVGSDEGLKWIQSPIIESNLFIGETHNYQIASDGWLDEGYDDSHWNQVVEVSPPDTNYYMQDCPADTIIRHIKPKLIKKFEHVSVYDIGENTTGYPILFCDSKKSETIIVRLGEEINADSSIDEARWHKQQSTFMTDGKPRYLHTRFTWHGFRYFEITNNAEAVDCVVIHANISVTSEFECDNKTINWLYNAYVRTQLSNMHSGIPSDCPHIERRGYTGDGQLTCEVAMLTLDAQKFYKKWIGDIADCQDRITGHVQNAVPYTRCGGGPGGWGCAIVVVPYVYYKQYGDAELLRELYPQMLRYFDYLELHSENNLVTSDRAGEWCLGDWCTPEKVQIPNPFVNNYFYIKSMQTVLEIASIIGVSEQNELLKTRIELRKNALVETYFDPETGNFENNIQGANAFAIDIGLGDVRTFENMVKHYKESGMYDTGIFGTDAVTRILFEHGEGALAFNLLASEKTISFHTLMEQGATTLWEYWTGERSHSHPMFGAVVRYLFEHILGIRQTTDSTGFEKVIIAPCDIPKLNYAKGKIMTKNGQVSVCYNRSDGHISFKIHVDAPIKAEFRFDGKTYLLVSGDNELVYRVR